MSADDAGLGLDELMIVNPGSPPDRESYFLGEDGSLYRIGGTGEGLAGEADVPSRFFLGDDGTLYEVVPGR